MYLTFAVLMGGMSFIGWRITKSVRQRDAILNHGTPDREANDTAANDTAANDTEANDTAGADSSSSA